MATSAGVRVIPLGGAGEIGKNMYVVEYGDRMVLIDCGITFPKNDQMGVDIVLPDFSYVVERRDNLEALILTHGHEDHIGAVPFLMRAVGHVPIYARRFTLGLLRAEARGAPPAGRRRADRGALRHADPGRPVRHRVHPAHPQHARLLGGRAVDPGGHDRAHRRLRHRVRARWAGAAATSPPSRGSASAASSCCSPTRPTPRRARAVAAADPRGPQRADPHLRARPAAACSSRPSRRTSTASSRCSTRRTTTAASSP